MYISFFSNELILYDSFSNILMTLLLVPIEPLSASWKWLVHTAFTGNACPTELQGEKKATRWTEQWWARQYLQLPLDLQLELILWLIIYSICNKNTVENYILYLETGNILVSYMNKYIQIYYVTPE